MSAEKPTIVLIPGAWHAGSTYEPVAALLRAQGYPAETLTLLSAGGPPSTSVAEDAEHIRKTLEPLIEQGKEVVLALHSYSGVPGSECVKGLTRKELEAQGKKGGIVAMVFVAAFLLPAGHSIDSFLPGGAGAILKVEVSGSVWQDYDFCTALFVALGMLILCLLLFRTIINAT
jgi:hypothetical protein